MAAPALDHEEEDLLDDDDTAPFAANAENKQLDKEVSKEERKRKRKQNSSFIL